LFEYRTIVPIAETMTTPTSQQPSRNRADLLERALELLICFSAERGEWGVTELATALGMTKSRVHRIVATLEYKGFLRRDPRTRRYRLGLRLFELGVLTVKDMNRSGMVRPILSRLAAELEATIVLRLRDGDQIVLVECIESPGPIRIILPLGSRYPIYYGAAGLAVCAALTDTELARILPRGKFSKFAPNSFKSWNEFRRAINDARANGYAFSDERVQPGVCSIGVAIRNSSGEAFGALAAGFAKAVLSDGDLPRIGRKLALAAEELKKLFGALETIGVGLEPTPFRPGDTVRPATANRRRAMPS